MRVLPVPLHRLFLDCELVKGEVTVGVRPKLPLGGIHFILGNGLAGCRVWAYASPSPVVTFCPFPGVSEGFRVLLEASASCVVTCAKAKSSADVASDSHGADVVVEVSPLSDFPVSLSQGEIVQEQCSNSSLKELFERAVSASEISSAAREYFVHDNVLLRKWVPVGENGVEKDVFQVVVPAKLCSLVLKVAHDDCGHFGVRKTYLNI